MFTDRFQPHIMFEEANDSGAEGAEPEGKDEGKKSPEDIMPEAEAAELRDALRKKRDSEAKYRTERNELKEQVDSLNSFKSKVENFFGEDEENPEQRIADLESENKRLKFTQSIRSACRKHGGDEELIVPLMLSKDGVEDVGGTVKELIEDNDKLKNGSAKKIGDENENGSSNEQPSMNDLIRQAAGR